MSDHRISDDGQTIICEAEPTARCRMAPDCDSETWTAEGCEDHLDHENNPDGHPVTPGHDCWMAEGHINPAGLSDTYGLQYEQGDPIIHPDWPVDIEFHGPDEGATWTYAEGDET